MDRLITLPASFVLPSRTHLGPLALPTGTIQPTGKRMDAPCCDVFRLVNGKIQSFDCYPSGTVIFAQLGVLSNIEAAIRATGR